MLEDFLVKTGFVQIFSSVKWTDVRWGRQSRGLTCCCPSSSTLSADFRNSLLPIPLGMGGLLHPAAVDGGDRLLRLVKPLGAGIAVEIAAGIVAGITAGIVAGIAAGTTAGVARTSAGAAGVTARATGAGAVVKGATAPSDFSSGGVPGEAELALEKRGGVRYLPTDE